MRVQPVTLENAQQRQSEAGSVLSGRPEKYTTPYGLPKKHTGRQIHQGMAFGESEEWGRIILGLVRLLRMASRIIDTQALHKNQIIHSSTQQTNQSQIQGHPQPWLPSRSRYLPQNRVRVKRPTKTKAALEFILFIPTNNTRWRLWATRAAATARSRPAPRRP